jgi:Predicted sugar phosphatases of the HAD superfamily
MTVCLAHATFRQYNGKELLEGNMDDRKKFLEGVRHFVLDMDGTFYLGDSILSGSLGFLEKVKETGRDFIFFTNNSSKNGKVYIEKLKKMNCFITEKEIMTSGDVTIEYLKCNYPGKKVYLLGTPMLEESFVSAGIELSSSDDADVAVLGFDQTLTYGKLVNICNMIREGKPYIATHKDINCPVEGGFIPDVGSFCALIALSTGGAEPRVLGKPNRETVDMVIERTGWKRKEIAFVGDRIYTDVATGVNNGAKGILVLSGEADMNTVRESSVKPDAIFRDLGEIGELLS